MGKHTAEQFEFNFEKGELWKCKFCGSSKGTWFSRTVPMGNFCEDCGKCADNEVEEDGDEIFTPMPKYCLKCRNGTLSEPLSPDKNGFMVCPKCGGSYGKNS